MNGLKISALLIIVGLCSYALLLSSRPSDSADSVETRTPPKATPEVEAKTEIYFSEPTSQISPGRQTEVMLMINSHENLVSQVQLELKYDPNEISVLSVKAADFFLQPILLTNEIDERRGRINFALALPENLPEVQGNANLAVFTLSIPQEATASSKTRLEFLPKTTVRGRNSGVSLLKNVRGVTLEKI